MPLTLQRHPQVSSDTLAKAQHMKAYIEKKYEAKQKEATEKQEGKPLSLISCSLGAPAGTNGQNELHPGRTRIHSR